MKKFKDLLNEWYKKDNYKVIDLPNNSKFCYVFISSNGLFGNNEQKNIQKLTENKYDWENISKSKKILKTASRLIFLRDIYTHSYVEGINKEINNIDKIVNLIKKLTEGYKIYFVGNSGGGYLAMILGSLLPNTLRVYSFGGIFSLYEWTGSHNTLSFEMDETFIKYKNDDRSKYYDIRELINKTKANIYHIYASKHIGDCKQIEIFNTKNANLHIFGFNTPVHGRGLNGFDYPDFLTIDDSKMQRITNLYENSVYINKNTFSIVSFGFFHFILKNIQKFFRHFSNKEK